LSGNSADDDPMLSPTKRALLEALIQEEGLGDSPSTAISPRRDGAPAVLSSAQELLWLLDQLNPGSTLYNRPSSLRLTGRLDVAAAQASFNEIVRRHTFGIDLPLLALFESPTVSDLSVAILQTLAEEREADELAQMLADLEALP
jgi:Condensation domain